MGAWFIIIMTSMVVKGSSDIKVAWGEGLWVGHSVNCLHDALVTGEHISQVP